MSLRWTSYVAPSKQWVTVSDLTKNWPLTSYAWPTTHRRKHLRHSYAYDVRETVTLILMYTCKLSVNRPMHMLRWCLRDMWLYYATLVKFTLKGTYISRLAHKSTSVYLQKCRNSLQSFQEGQLPVADWPTGKPGDFPVGPCFRNFFGPPAVHELISLIISWHSQQIGSAFSKRVTTCAVWVHSEWANDGDVFYSIFTCRLRPTRIKTISNK